MPKDRKIENLPADDLEALTTAQADWDGVADEVPPDEATPDKASPEDDEEMLEDVLGVEAEDEDDVIGEDDDNPYQESDEALPDDAEERRSYDRRAPADPALAMHVASLKWAEAILFVYPTWWYGLPAMLKGWLDRVWATEVAFRLPPDGGRIVSLVPHITRIGVVTTCGATWWLSFLMGQPGRKTILRGMRALCAPTARTLYVAHYDMDRATPETRAAFLKRVGTKVLGF